MNKTLIATNSSLFLSHACIHDNTHTHTDTNIYVLNVHIAIGLDSNYNIKLHEIKALHNHIACFVF